MSAVRSNNDGTNLIVNYLPQTVDEDELSDLFSECGMIEAVKVIRDGESQISRGFAFIKYVDKKAADKAMKQFTGYKMGKKTLRVSLSRPRGEDTRDTNLLIDKLPSTIDDDQLYEQFSVYGKIITHRVCMGPDGQSKCRAYVRYDKKSEAEDAITGLNGVEMGNGEALVVRFADPPVVKPTPELLSKKTMRPAVHPYPPPPRSMRGFPMSRSPYGDDYYMGPYAYPARGMQMRGRMGPYRGMERDTGEDRGLGITHVEADLTNVPENHKSSFDQEKGWCLFVYNLPPTAANETLYQLFSRFGAINTVKPVVDESNCCKGYGFVHMINYEDACNAIEVLDGNPFQGKSLQVRFKNAKK